MGDGSKPPPMFAKEGRSTGRGTHAELVALGGSCARMNSIQSAEGIA